MDLRAASYIQSPPVFINHVYINNSLLSTACTGNLPKQLFFSQNQLTYIKIRLYQYQPKVWANRIGHHTKLDSLLSTTQQQIQKIVNIKRNKCNYRAIS